MTPLSCQHTVALLLAVMATPTLTATSIEYTLLEEQSSGHFVGNLVKDAGLDSKYDSATVDELTFAILTKPKEDKGFFSVHHKDGVIRTAMEVDRDSVCPSTETCTLKYDVAVRPMKYFQILKVVVTLLDINDNYPQFPSRDITREISEAALPGASYPIPEAEDPDSGDYSIQGYKLVDSSEKFELQVSKTADGGTDVRLILRHQLDREKEDFYQVKIGAYDGGNPRKTSYMTVDIKVLDANDHDPKFTNTTYDVYVPENTPVGASILRVKAHDPDQGKNGEVVYRFDKQTENDFSHLFALRPHSGELIVRGKLDYEINSIYLLSLTARDQGPDSLPAHASVVVRIEDMNDNSPDIQINTLTSSGDAEVAENSKIGTFVAHITVKDLDSGSNGQFSCSLDSRKFQLQKLSQSEYKLVTASAFDREQRHRYRLNIKCRDMGQPSHLTSAKLKVNVVDQNDHKPQFEQQTYSTAMEENNDANAFILQVTAVDNDSGTNGRLTYELAEDAGSAFSIDKSSGVITANVRFDHERMTERLFHVVARDSGTPPRSAVTTVLVKIVDLNDEPPRFTTATYEFSIYENRPSNSEVGKLMAIDHDSEPYNQFSYSLDQSRHGVNDFVIDPITGVIRTRVQLDREAISTYYLIAMATALDDPRMQSTASVTVYVGDQNDHAPKILFPSPINHTVHVSKESPVDYKFIRVSAVDRDSGKNARLTYTIDRGNKDNTFSIDPNTGAVSVARPLKDLTNQVFELGLKVYDRGDLQQVSNARLNIVVSNTVAFPYMNLQFFSGDNLYKVIGLGAAALLLIIFTVVAVLILRRKQGRHDDKEELEMNAKERESMLGAVDKEPPEQYTRLNLRAKGDPGCDITSSNDSHQHLLLDVRHQQCNGRPLESWPTATAQQHRGGSPGQHTHVTEQIDLRQATVPVHSPGPCDYEVPRDMDASDSASSLSDSGRGPSGDEGDSNQKNSSAEHEQDLGLPGAAGKSIYTSKPGHKPPADGPRRARPLYSPLAVTGRTSPAAAMIAPPAYHTLGPQHRRVASPVFQPEAHTLGRARSPRTQAYQGLFKQEPRSGSPRAASPAATPQLRAHPGAEDSPHVTIDPKVHILEGPAPTMTSPDVVTPTKDRPFTSILKSHRPREHVMLKHSDIEYIDESDTPITDV